MKLTILVSFAVGVVVLDGALLYKVIKDSNANETALYETLYKKAYEDAYSTCSSDYKQLLLDEGFAEYDRKTGMWRLLNATEIQGSLIEPSKRSAFVNIDAYEKHLQDELVAVHKQKSFTDKNKLPVDFKKPL